VFSFPLDKIFIMIFKTILFVVLFTLVLSEENPKVSADFIMFGKVEGKDVEFELFYGLRRFF
jgi:hypothetical protein